MIEVESLGVTPSSQARRALPVLSRADALVLVDMQRDFLPGGCLAVPGSDAVLAPANACIEYFGAHGSPIFATRDWHPTAHCSFQDTGGSWPPHCVAGSEGAEFAPALRLPAAACIVPKGRDARDESQSAFGGTQLHARLHAKGVLRIYVAGLATDRCVLQTVLDALDLGYDVVVLVDAVAAANSQPGDGERALASMQSAGAQLATSGELTGVSGPVLPNRAARGPSAADRGELVSTSRAGARAPAATSAA